ncbi:glycoside hydrolase family 3 C-terminal domain-containing protein [Alkalitalea saponilacus]|nr:glycoside hydrolase family 3 C-terminal domain-containing protein [Alkalitalea saponilacus]
MDTSLDNEERVKDLVSRMTLEEKVFQMLHEAPAIERLGIPEYNWWNECLHGVARAGLATVFPQAIGMAAMWDDQMMFDIADAISDEARAKHHDFAKQGKRGMSQGLTFWTPNINIFRDPRWGRGMETYGECPYLTGELAVNFIRGLQGDHPDYLKLVATAKHFAVHSGPEPDRHSFNVHPSQRDLVETYYPHFKKAVKEAGVYSFMCAYNRLFDEPCCGSEYLNSLLRDEWGFEGYVVSDCWAILDFYNPGDHEVVENAAQASALAVRFGTDLNCGSSYPALLEAVANGYITEEEIDVSVSRLILARMKLGMFDPPSMVPFAHIPYDVVDSELHRKLALEAARKSMVLLKNDNNTLPFSKNVSSVAVIGPNAHNVDALLANYNGYPSEPITPYQGISRKLPSANVKYALGSRYAEEFPYMTVIPSHILFTDETLSENGLQSEYFNNIDFRGNPEFSGFDPKVDFQWWTNSPKPGVSNDEFSVRWSGYLVPDVSGKYALGVEGFSGFRLYLDDELIVENFSLYHSMTDFKFMQLEAGKKYKIVLEFYQDNNTHPMVRLLWDKPGQNLKQEAIELAAQSDLVILCMGLSPLLEGEEMAVDIPGFFGGDRTDIVLPAIQTDLVKAIMELGKPTVMVLLNGSALAFNWEADNVPAIIEAWYPGQAGGQAIADVLFGDYNPAGRLPVTFYKSINQIPDFSDYSMDGRTYRYFKGEPLYEFGFGLSYTTFDYSELNIDTQVMADESFDVSVLVTNTGSMDGDEVVQLYVSYPDNHMAPIRSLQGFRRVFIPAGESREVKFNISPDQIGLFHPEHGKVVSAGKIHVYVGGKQPDSISLKNGNVVMSKVEILGEFICR